MISQIPESAEVIEFKSTDPIKVKKNPIAKVRQVQLVSQVYRDQIKLATVEESNAATVLKRADLVTIYDLFKIRSISKLLTRKMIVEQIVFLVITVSFHLVTIAVQPSYQAFTSLSFSIPITGALGSVTAFLLGLYVNTTLNRWWELRLKIGKIWAATVNLTWLLTTCHHTRPGLYTTSNKEIVDCITKISLYGRLSLCLIFHRYGQAHFTLKELVDRKVINTTEAQKIITYKIDAETVWTWVLNLIFRLYSLKIIDDEIIFHQIRQFCFMGKGAAAGIHAQIGTPLPVVYTWLVLSCVKTFQLLLSIQVGIYMTYIGFGDPDKNTSHTLELPVEYLILGDSIIIIFLQVISISFSGLVVLAQMLENPFDNDPIGHPGMRYENGIRCDCKSYIAALKTDMDHT